MTRRIVGTSLLVVAWALAGCSVRESDSAAAKLKRECAALVDLVLEQKKSIATADLTAALKEHGVTMPPEPEYRWVNRNADDETARYQKEQAVYTARWDEVRSQKVYSAAWDTVIAKKRIEAVERCIEVGAAKQGAVVR